MVLENLFNVRRKLGPKGFLPDTAGRQHGAVLLAEMQAVWRRSRRSEAIGRQSETVMGPSWTLCNLTADVAAIATG